MRERLLVRLFLLRFFEHDLVSPDADRREILSVVGGGLVAASLFVSTLLALRYQFNNFEPPGLTQVQSIDDRFFFVSASMLVMALLAVALWDALALDARDASVLGILPIPRGVVVRSKFVAVALVAVTTDAAWNLAPTLMRVVAVPLKLPIGLKGALTLTLAQGVVTLAAGAFGFLAVLALREGLTAVVGQQRFRAISSALQAALLVVLTSGLLLLPGSSTGVSRTWLAHESLATRALPPLWFVGLHESLAGSVLDRLPRTRPENYLLVAERNATNLYRQGWPLYRRLAKVAVWSLVVFSLLTVTACMWNARRLPTPAVRRRRQWRRTDRAWRFIVARFLTTTSVQRAGFWFTLQTLPRRVTHRVLLASGAAVGLSLILITVRERLVTIQADVASIPIAVLAAQSLLLSAVVTGFRRAIQLPAELHASSTFSLAWNGNLQQYLSGVKRAGLVAFVLPLLAVLFVWHAAVLGVRVALVHFATGLAFSMLLMQTLLVGYRRVPLASAYVPSQDLKFRGVLYVTALAVICAALAWIERTALAAGPAYVVVLEIALVGVIAGVKVFDRSHATSTTALQLHEEPVLPTQRLNLAG